MPVFLKDAQTYLLPLNEKRRRPSQAENDVYEAAAPLRLHWNRISMLTAGAKVFIGGTIETVGGQEAFVSRKDSPLLVIFYECSERTLASGVLRAGRHRNEYWNTITPYSLIGGVFSLLWIAQMFINRPAYRTTVLSAVVAIFGPLLPLVPPGLLLTLIYRRLWWVACMYRVFRDAALLPLKYTDADADKGGDAGEGVNEGGEADKSPDAERYECRPLEGSIEEGTPRLLPAETPEKGEVWHIFGAVNADGQAVAPSNAFVPYGLLPGKPEHLARAYKRRALAYEIAAWTVLAAGLALNVLFAELVIYFAW